MEETLTTKTVITLMLQPLLKELIYKEPNFGGLSNNQFLYKQKRGGEFIPPFFMNNIELGLDYIFLK
jgi:hypothetical protein